MGVSINTGKRSKKNFAKALLLVNVVLMVGKVWAGAYPEADKVLKEVRDREDGKDYVSNVTLVMKDKDGDARERLMYMLQKDMEGKEMNMLLFHRPSDVRGVGFMMSTYPESLDKDDDQWMYFPAFRKIRRIAAQDKRGSFMGSTFAYTDLDKVRVSDFESNTVKEDTVLGRNVWVIERLPKSQDVINKTGYHKTVMYVDKERFITMKQEYYDIKGIKFKEQLSKSVEEIEGIWTITESVMTNFEDNRVSIMKFADMDYNVNLEDEFFSRRVLKRGLNVSDVPQLSSN